MLNRKWQDGQQSGCDEKTDLHKKKVGHGMFHFHGHGMAYEKNFIKTTVEEGKKLSQSIWFPNLSFSLVTILSFKKSILSH